ncbi:MAG: hypothetical protein LQ352_006140 [Teloschistes flavicans]|nr:MAG: hypothetical protein LQ352_006140 [Teloschistes flavicans]
MDALGSFIHLTDNIPDWLSKLDSLAVQVAEQHSRFKRLSHTQFTKVRLSKKHDSTESLRPPKDDADDHVPIHFPETSVPPKDIPATSQPLPENTLVAKDIQRKRKSDSADLSGASGPQRYRTRSMVIVYYNSAIQEAFESLVRDIASARNNLRKGKTAASFKARMALIAMGTDDDEDGYPILNPKLLVKCTPRGSSLAADPSFDEVDGHLEAAQNLCEVAAHQFLRDGDCEEELAGTRQRFEDCLKTAKEEADKLQIEDVKEDEGARNESPTKTSQPNRTGFRPGVLAADKIQAPRIPTFPSGGTIEVDDESDKSSVHIDLSALRRTRRV